MDHPAHLHRAGPGRARAAAPGRADEDGAGWPHRPGRPVVQLDSRRRLAASGSRRARPRPGGDAAERNSRRRSGFPGPQPRPDDRPASSSAPPAPPTPIPLLRLGAIVLRSDPALGWTGRHATSEVLPHTGFRFDYPTLDEALADLLPR
ncbi:DUF1731 domain-containing protein [Nocardia wallacei]|uniref:DUF1731 domain-containing protein n=1 Tax=Nocardia wallacei TaxID=480035 RepID=UPI0024543406|nr:DUF1731 domain-containing protein [Nocardia wallacei]